MDVLSWDELGWEELLDQGISREELYLHVAERACRSLGLESAVVPPGFPVELADHLRAGRARAGRRREAFTRRRRVKNEAELRASGAHSGPPRRRWTWRGLLRSADASGDVLMLDGEPLTCERVKQEIGEVFTAHDMAADELIVSHGGQSAIGHDMGSGPISPDEPIVIDPLAQDRETGCHADMTRTYCVGEPPEELGYHRLVKQALDEAIAGVRGGASGHELYRATCELPRARLQDAADEGSRRDARGGVLPRPGPRSGAGSPRGPRHGARSSLLVAGDVVTVEPGLYRPGFGGCRLEDLLLVTEDGCENLTDYPYDLAP